MTVEDTRWSVVINDEEQYSIWAVGRDVPVGWRIVRVDGVDVEGSREDCLAHIERVWTDMRPKSLRDRLARRAEAEARQSAARPSAS
ncbi:MULTISPECIES: MbtH family protein [unclassified Embleya]|uniref:MbtH family protein n=1 Tax=unclassified Embleya TaxID=2699296 RepID=UPI0036868FED